VAAARERAVAAWPDAFRGTDLDPEAGRARREKLLARVESLSAQAEPPASALSGQDLARRLKEALATNTMGGRGEAEAKRRAEVDEVKAAQAAWRRLPPLPGDAGRGLGAALPRGLRPLLPRSSVRPRREPLALTARRYRLVAGAPQAGRRADEVARDWLTEVLGSVPSRAAVRRLVMAGGLRVRGLPLRAPGRLIDAGAPARADRAPRARAAR
jgi:hypothetical protein